MSGGIRIPDGRESSIPRESNIPTEKPKTKESSQPVSTRWPVKSKHTGKSVNNEKILPGGRQNGAQAAKTTIPVSPQKTAFANQHTIGRGNNPSPSNLTLQESLLQKSIESSGKTTFSAMARQTAAALGLPADTLSVTLLALSRFFSLSINQTLIASLRREVLASVNISPPKTAKELSQRDKAALEAKALGLAAAFDKGVTLSPEALERYARYIDFPVLEENGEAGNEDTTPPSEDATGDTSGGTAGNGGKGSQRNPADKDEVPNKLEQRSQELRALAEKGAQEDVLLDFLNVLPGKNGQHWIVFPFKIKVKGTELKVFIRLLKEEPLSFRENEHLIVDIAGPKRQYRCFLEKFAGKLRADIRVYPEMKPKALKMLTKEAKRFLNEGGTLIGNYRGFEEILVQNGKEAPSWVEDFCTQHLSSVNEEV